MKKYWLFIDSYVFLWQDTKKILIYNCLSRKGFTLNRNAIIDPVIEQINDKKNLRVAQVDSNFLSTKEGKELVILLRDHFCGDFLDQESFPVKPVVVLPELNNNEEVGRSANTLSNIEGFGSQVAKNLLEVTLQLTGECKENCPLCNYTNKQIRWCSRNDSFFPEEKLVTFLEKLKASYIYTLNLIGGDLSTYPYWSTLIDLLKDASFHRCAYFHIHQLEKSRSLINSLKENHFNIVIVADAATSRIPEQLDKEVHYLFSVTSPEEFEMIQIKIEKEKVNAKVLPTFTGQNYSFFKDYILQSEDDILTTPWKQKEIFAHQVLNTNDFGNFYVRSDGRIFANINEPSFGTIENDLEQLIHQEMKSGFSWRKTRDRETICCDCLYRYLCPSPSNYERAIGRPNLCLIKRE